MASSLQHTMVREVVMARSNTRKSEPVRNSQRCSVCGAVLRLEDWCRDEPHAYGGLSPEQYAELFWEEA